MKKKYRPLSFLCILTFVCLFSAAQDVRVEPPFWWVGMQNQEVQLLLHSPNIADYAVEITSPGIKTNRIVKTENPNYLFLYLNISPDIKAGNFPITLIHENGQSISLFYSLKARSSESKFRKGFDQSDIVYLLMPDRFANGNPDNDSKPEMLEKANRQNPDGRHGGDLAGISNHLDYIKDLGMTALWLNPFLENNMPAYSYHGYAISDFYKTDSRIGTNTEFADLVNQVHRKGLKIIMDQVLNHCATNHYFIKDIPSTDWIHQWPTFTKSSFRASVIIDPYAAASDKKIMSNGWFDTSMADLNQNQPELAVYLIQNSIWWIEFAGLDGIRMDTYQYADAGFMTKWTNCIMDEYPNFSIVGELWIDQKALHGYWMKDACNLDAYNSNLEYLTDFPLNTALKESFADKDYGWDKRAERLYYCLAQDIVYKKPFNQMIFLDNHDLSRFYTTCKEDFRKFTLGLAFIMTSRGMPQIQYGTEILMTGEEFHGHGLMRKDFPGGWPNDRKNAFIPEGRSEQQNKAWNLIHTLAKWRNEKTLIHTGKLTQYLPENDVYVYFRHNENEIVMVALNYNDKDAILNTQRYKENMGGAAEGFEIISNDKLTNLENIRVPASSAVI
ncbi:MAG: glycoside hydrolase family 13 protein, partial [Bacteroidales bacterium]|nr:glycoside hydrolase family 13 protein [Bacteroidales bacterium]